MLLALVERIAYAVTRGAIKAIWEELRKPRTAVDEEVTDEDRAIEDRLRGRFADWLQANPDGDTGPDNAAPGKPPHEGSGMA